MVAHASSEEMRMMHTSLAAELNGLKDIVLKLTSINATDPSSLNIHWLNANGV